LAALTSPLTFAVLDRPLGNISFGRGKPPLTSAVESCSASCGAVDWPFAFERRALFAMRTQAPFPAPPKGPHAARIWDKRALNLAQSLLLRKHAITGRRSTTPQPFSEVQNHHPNKPARHQAAVTFVTKPAFDSKSVRWQLHLGLAMLMKLPRPPARPAERRLTSALVRPRLNLASHYQTSNTITVILWLKFIIQ
jgi:hypothetical protein